MYKNYRKTKLYGKKELLAKRKRSGKHKRKVLGGEGSAVGKEKEKKKIKEEILCTSVNGR